MSFAQMGLLYLPSPSIEYMMSEQMLQCLYDAKPESVYTWTYLETASRVAWPVPVDLATQEAQAQ